jgi:hypothetical protein
MKVGAASASVEKKREGATSAPMEEKMKGAVAPAPMQEKKGGEEVKGGHDLYCPPLELGVDLGGACFAPIRAGDGLHLGVARGREEEGGHDHGGRWEDVNVKIMVVGLQPPRTGALSLEGFSWTIFECQNDRLFGMGVVDLSSLGLVKP